jgi:hypothetical protein
MRRMSIIAALAVGLAAFPAAAMADRGGDGNGMPHKNDPPTLRHFAEPWDGWGRGKPFWNKRFDAYARLTPAAGKTTQGHTFLRQRDGALTVRLEVGGLVAGSRHAAVIRQGTCAAGTPALTLPDLIANNRGRAKLYVALPTAAGADYAAAGFSVSVQESWGDVTGAALACGDVRDRGQKGTARVRPYAGGGDAHGQVQVKQKAGTTHVWINLKGLVPASTHAQRVLVGTCGTLGAVALELPVATADANGRFRAHYQVATAGDLFATPTAYALHTGDATTPAAACGELRGSHHGAWWWNWHS